MLDNGLKRTIPLNNVWLPENTASNNSPNLQHILCDSLSIVFPIYK